MVGFMGNEQDWASRVVNEHYGSSGLQVYQLIDGKKSILEISKEVGLNQQKVIEIIKFMENEGIIKLDYGSVKGSVASLSFELPQVIYDRMQQHSEINWSDVTAKLLNVYLNSIEGAEKFLIEKTKKSKSAARKAPKTISGKKTKSTKTKKSHPKKSGKSKKR